MESLLRATAGEQAAAVRRGQISAAELLEEYLVHIARTNPALNAIVTLDEDGAWERARRADSALAGGAWWGPLHGVPITVKDSLKTAGMRTTSGHPPLADYVPTEDATCVARLRAAGATILGKTNLPELCIGPQSDNPLFGRANNPWDLGRTPGGSTGGGAAAVASCMSPLSIGSDAGGSVRIPAHYCGIWSLKPTEHRVPTTGHIHGKPGAPRGLRHLITVGPLARSLEDLELTLKVIAGPDSEEWEVPPVPYASVPPRSVTGLRIGWAETIGGIPITADTRTALVTLVTDLARAGATVAHGIPAGFDFDTVWETCMALFEAEISPSFPPEEAAKWTMARYADLLVHRDRHIRVLEEYFDDWDVLLLPVTAGPAIPHCLPNSPVQVDGLQVEYWKATAGYTFPFNLTGHPVVVVPLGMSSDGLPIGVQMIGRRWSEEHLIASAREIARLIAPVGNPPASPGDEAAGAQADTARFGFEVAGIGA